MTLNPADVDVHKHLGGANYPASGEDLASVAQRNDAPGALVEGLRDLGDEMFSGPDEVRAALVRRSARHERNRILRRPD